MAALFQNVRPKRTKKRDSTELTWTPNSLQDSLNQPPRDNTPASQQNAKKMRFYEEFSIFIPKIQNGIEQICKIKLDNFTKRIYIGKYENVFSQNG
jgi:hypothetical protein